MLENFPVYLRTYADNHSSISAIYDEMYLQKSQKYFGREMIGFDDEEELYKGIDCFMIVGLKESIPHVIKSSTETDIDANWFGTEL